ncbi:MAG: efflux RND transporter permease subunit [Candidatus Pseudobacter hemicellulosilyticus]|uniref:Efflux RND transporter permease subunit n=1 Tax=Candidatus Pseudobacter hemicellulosilyticus TaxID=3121375 RepID=A0AAJ5WPT1_9BACT|nr:MAG: efflux RND transporter permease subunit [Pseudobacter sp.]
MNILSPFRVLLIFLTVSITAFFAIRNLPVELAPKDSSPVLNLAFQLNNSSPDVVEQQVTSLLENGCSSLRGLKQLNSVSNYNGGTIQLSFDRSVDLNYKKIELAAIIRRIYPQLPQGAGYPLISEGQPTKKNVPLLIYSVNADLQVSTIKEQTEAIFRKACADVPGLKEVVVSGDAFMQLNIRFDKEKCRSWHIDAAAISSSLNNYFQTAYPGTINTGRQEQYFMQLPAPQADVQVVKDLSIPTLTGQYVSLKDFAEVYIQEEQPGSYYRINGKNSVSISFFARTGQNELIVAKRIKTIASQLGKKLPEGFTLHAAYDNTTAFREEVNRNYRRLAIALSILLVFILLSYRNWRYACNLFIGLAGALSLTAVAAFLSGISIHLYTLAGLAVAFGIAIDNGIVMLDHYHRQQNRKIFLAILGANLTTIAALSVVFLLPEEEQKNLRDFIIIIITTLAASLLSALWLTPALYKLMPVPKKHTGPGHLHSHSAYRQRIRQLIRENYERSIVFLAHHRKIFLGCLVLAFGLPLFMLPARWDGNNWYQQWYNSSLGNEYYLQNIRPVTDKWLGGSLRLFLKEVYEKRTMRDPGRTILYLTAALPAGNTPEQLNNILTGFENYLLSVKGVAGFITNIHSGQYGAIEISFTDSAAVTSFPNQLKSSLISRSLDWGGVTWSVYGVGQGFNNGNNDGFPGYAITMKGYNYDELEKQANRLARKLGREDRVRNINTNSRLNYTEKESREYVLELNPRLLALSGTDNTHVLKALTQMAQPAGAQGQITIHNQYYAVNVSATDAARFSPYTMMKEDLFIDAGTLVRLDKLGGIVLRSTVSSIYKENRQYIRVLGFEYMGPAQAGQKILDTTLKAMRTEIPAGYTAVDKSNPNSWGTDTRPQRQPLAFALLAIIFFMGSIIFGSLRKPFFMIAVIPVSYMGLMLLFYLGGFHFDQGGYAAFILLGALVANAAILVINDHNTLQKADQAAATNRLLLRAVSNRARTVVLTSLSACCSMIPFLLEGDSQVFWFALAIGAIGGSVFSLFAVLIVLPVLLWQKNTPVNGRE